MAQDWRTDNSGLWWQIALGVFLGMTAANVLSGIYTRWELSRATEQLQEYTQKQEDVLARQLERHATERQYRSQQRPPAYQRAPATNNQPLAENERCIDGIRLRKNGSEWQQAGRC